MKLLTFLAPRFAWRAEVQSLPEVPAAPLEGEVRDAVVVFVHAVAGDEEPEADRRALRHALKHVKWLAGKRDLRRAVLHSFTHLAGEHAPPEHARDFLDRLQARLEGAGFEVVQTPFGYSCAWDLSVHGESLAKVWKEI